MRYGGGNTHCEKRPEPENNFNPETGLYEFRLMMQKFWVKRCQGKSVITGEQCQGAALKTSKTQKCLAHGGNSGHKKNPALAKLKTKTGEFTREKVAKKRRASADIKMLGEVLAFLEGSIIQDRKTGANNKHYHKITNMDEAEAFLKDKAKRDAELK